MKLIFHYFFPNNLLFMTTKVIKVSFLKIIYIHIKQIKSDAEKNVLVDIR